MKPLVNALVETLADDVVLVAMLPTALPEPLSVATALGFLAPESRVIDEPLRSAIDMLETPAKSTSLLEFPVVESVVVSNDPTKLPLMKSSTCVVVAVVVVAPELVVVLLSVSWLETPND